MRLLFLLAIAPLLAGCPGLPDEDPIAACPEDKLFYAEACDQWFCGEPTARVGIGTSSYVPVQDGDEVPIWYGTQGGYHVHISVEMTGLCEIIWMRPWFEVVGWDGTIHQPAFEQLRHVQALRADPQEGSLQRWWSARAFLPCEFWPDDVHKGHQGGCYGRGGRSGIGHLEDFGLRMGVEVWDHNPGPDGEPGVRRAADEAQVQPYCCGGSEHLFDL